MSRWCRFPAALSNKMTSSQLFLKALLSLLSSRNIPQHVSGPNQASLMFYYKWPVMHLSLWARTQSPRGIVCHFVMFLAFPLASLWCLFVHQQYLEKWAQLRSLPLNLFHQLQASPGSVTALSKYRQLLRNEARDLKHFIANIVQTLCNVSSAVQNVITCGL